MLLVAVITPATQCVWDELSSFSYASPSLSNIVKTAFNLSLIL